MTPQVKGIKIRKNGALKKVLQFPNSKLQS